MEEIVIKIFTEDYKADVIDLILDIQQNFTKIVMRAIPLIGYGYFDPTKRI